VKKKRLVGVAVLGLLATSVPLQSAGAIDPITLFSFRGRVTDPWSLPVVGASVREGAKTALTDAAGDYKLDESRFGEFTLVASKPSMTTSAPVIKTFQLSYRLTALLNKPYISTASGPTTAMLTINTFAPSPGSPGGAAQTSCVYALDNRTGIETAASWVAVDGDGSNRWVHTLSLPATTTEARYQLTAVARDCATGQVVSQPQSVSYTVDNTAPEADSGDLFPNDFANAAVASPVLVGRAYDHRSPIDPTSISFTVFDETDGTARTFAGATATRYSSATQWAKTAAGVPFTAGHTYRLRLTVRDAAGNQVTAEQTPAADGGGFLATTVTVPTAPAGEIVERPCAVRQPQPERGETMASVECFEVPVDFTPVPVQVAASKTAGGVPVHLAVPLSGVTIRYGAAGALSQPDTSVDSSTAEATATATGVTASTVAVGYTAPAAQAVIPKVTATIVPGFDTATVAMAPVTAAATLAGCSDPTASADVVCTPDHVVPDAPNQLVKRASVTAEWNDATGGYTLSPITVQERETDSLGNVVTTNSSTVNASSGSSSGPVGNGCESSEPGRVNSKPPLRLSSGPVNGLNKLAFGWLFYTFMKDDGRVWSDASKSDIAEICYTGWHNPGRYWRMTMSGATVGLGAADAVVIGSNGGKGKTTEPTTSTLEIEITGGPVRFRGSLEQGAVSEIRAEPGPGPQETEFPDTPADAMHSAWWQYKCHGFTFACMTQYEGSTGSQGNVGHVAFTLRRELYSEQAPPPIEFDTYTKTHCASSWVACASGENGQWIANGP
jgi:hypothetical protein